MAVFMEASCLYIALIASLSYIKINLPGLVD